MIASSRGFLVQAGGPLDAKDGAMTSPEKAQSLSPRGPGLRRAGRSPMRAASFDGAFTEAFATHFEQVYRYLNRLSGDPDLAADIAQEAFVRLYQRQSLPETPAAWLITVAMNLLRNAATQRARRERLLTAGRAEAVLADPPASPAEAAIGGDLSPRVRAALDSLPERDRSMLLLRAEGCTYSDIAAVLGANEASIGTLLARAKRGFRDAYGATGGEGTNAP